MPRACHRKADREKPQLTLRVLQDAIRTGQTEVAVFTAYEPEE
ncbi:Hok/Gef family protein [Escherichia coli]